MTVDGICDHTAGLPDEEIHDHYTDLLGQGDVILYGRTTYALMEYWRQFLEKPSEEKSMNDFAVAIDRIPKIVFSRTIKEVDWASARVATRDLKDEILALKQEPGKDIFVGSRSLIVQLLNLGLIDEFQLCIYPMLEGKGLRFFDEIKERIIFKLTKTRIFKSGAMLMYYQPEKG